jgi:sortase A
MTFPHSIVRKLGATLVVAGALLLAIFIVPTVYGSAMSHLAVAQFRAQSKTNSLWDSSRIRAYKSTLNLTFAPPEGVLRIPRLGVEVPILEGTSDPTLNRGVGHVAGTALPGETGNLAITGHRDGFFRPLKDIAPGDIIHVDRPSAAPGQPPTTDQYVVQNIKIVFPTDTSVLNHTSSSTLTLITCYPFYYVGAAPQRFIVQASLVPPANGPAASGSARPTRTMSVNSGD